MSDSIHDNNKPYCYKYPHPALTVDCVVFGFHNEHLSVVLIRRGIEPFKDHWALPGGFVNIDETVEEAAARELAEETNISEIYLEQFKMFSAVDRDPRERVVTLAFLGIVRPDECSVKAGDDAASAMWFDIAELPPLAFDHAEIIYEAREYLSRKIRLEPVAFAMLNPKFTVDDLRRVYEEINCVSYDRRNFHRKLMQSDLVEETDEIQSNGASRPARLFTFNGDVGLTNITPSREEEKDGDIMKQRLPFNFCRMSPEKTSTEPDMFQDMDEDNTTDRRRPDGSIKDLFNF